MTSIQEQIDQYRAEFDAKAAEMSALTGYSPEKQMVTWNVTRLRRALDYAEVDQRAGATEPSARAAEAYAAPEPRMDAAGNFYAS